jgi:hypothetical protein
MKNVAIWLLLALCLCGFALGAIYHRRFIKAGGQQGFHVVPRNQLSETAQSHWKRMLLGYGIFLGTIAAMLFIAAA